MGLDLNSFLDKSTKILKGLDRLSDGLDKLDFAIKGLDKIGKQVDKFSSMSNDLLQYSGSTGKAVREFRSSVLETVSKLNKDTGFAYNAQESYARVIEATKGITGDLGAINEMARPLLLSYESLDVNVSTVADLFNRFYVKYNFSSQNMESTLDTIRGNTAGNSANAEATMNNIKSLEVWLNNAAGNDNEMRTKLLEQASHYTSYLESMNLDSKASTDYLLNLAKGNFSDTGTQFLLTQSGYSALEAQSMAREGKWEDLTLSRMQSIYNIIDAEDMNRDNRIGGGELVNAEAQLANLGISLDEGMSIWNAMNSKNFKTFEDFLATVKENPTTEDIVEDKYISMGDKVNNWLSKIYGKLASIQELNPLGFGFSDVALGAIGLKKIIDTVSGSPLKSFLSGGTGGSLANLGGGGGAAGTLPTVATSAFGSSSPLLSKLGGGLATGAGGTTAAGLSVLGGASAGVAMGVYGAKSAYDEFSQVSDRNSDVLNNSHKVSGGLAVGSSVAGLGGTAALVALGASNNPIGWIALAVGGIALVGKAAYDNAHELSGNAKEVEKSFTKIRETLKEENTERLKLAASMKKEVAEANTVTEKLQILSDSKVFSERTLNTLKDNEGAVQELTTAYLDAAKNLPSQIESLLSGREIETKQVQDKQQKEFLSSFESTLRDHNGQAAVTDDINNVLSILMSGVTDKKLLDKYNKHLKSGGKLTYKEAIDLVSGGDNAWFDKNNLTDKGISVSAMETANTAYNIAPGISFKAFSEDDESRLANNFATFQSLVSTWKNYKSNDSTKDSLMQDAVDYYNKTLKKDASLYKDSSSYKAALEGYADQLGIKAFKTGSNYIEEDQLAVVHEGEAIVPKQFNPAIFNAEYTKNTAEEISTSNRKVEDTVSESNEYFADFLSEMKDIKKLLSDWKNHTYANSGKQSPTIPSIPGLVAGYNPIP